MDLEKCIKGYEDGNQNATITNDTFCAGFLDKDACGVSTDQLKLSINILYIYISDESKPSWLEQQLELKDFQLGSARDLFPFSSKSKIGRKRAKI